VITAAVAGISLGVLLMGTGKARAAWEEIAQLLSLQGKPEPASAMFAFNDISAIGAIRALREKGLPVPEDVSVVGFDDIQSAAYQNPGLTTVRQPLCKMGKIAADTVLRRIARDGAE
jgi:LacI family transcriptional regulator